MTSSTVNAIGPLIKRLREERNVTRSGLARACGFSRNYLIDVEDGETPTISEENLRRIAECLESDPIALLQAMAAIKGVIAITVKDQPEEIRQLLYRLASRKNVSPETAAKLAAILDEEQPLAA